MNLLEWTIGLRYTIIGKGDKFVSFTSLISAIGIALGVAAVIVVMSVMNGFHINLRERILAASSHVEIVIPPDENYQWTELFNEINNDERIIGVAPQIDRQGLISANNNVYGALLKGVDPALELAVSKFVNDTSLDLLVEGEFKIYLGEKLAQRLRVSVNDELVIIAPTGIATLGGVLPRFKKVSVAGLVSLGVHQYDNSIAYMHYRDLAKLFNLEQIDTIRIRLDDVFLAPTIAQEITDKNNLRTYDWTASNAVLFNALAVERRVMFVILSLIIAVAAFQIVATLVTIVRSKKAAIAILRTLGLTPNAIVRIFLIQGMLVGVVGTIIGVILGIILAINVDQVVGIVERLFGIDFFPGEVYFLDTIPAEIQIQDVFSISLLAFALTLLATIFPSLSAARIKPAEVLRHE